VKLVIGEDLVGLAEGAMPGEQQAETGDGGPFEKLAAFHRVAAGQPAALPRKKQPPFVLSRFRAVM
jgi:hypothetical protein